MLTNVIKPSIHMDMHLKNIQIILSDGLQRLKASLINH